MDKVRYCNECGTQNEPDFEYCKNCGTLLEIEEDAAKPEWLDDADVGVNPVGGIPAKDMVCFVGKNGNRIVRKWSDGAAFGHRLAWCWPAFWLSLIFGALGAGFWCLYRRMYKLGAFIFATAFVFNVAGVLAHADSLSGFIIDFADSFKQSTDIETDTLDTAELSERLSLLFEGEDAEALSNYADSGRAFNIAISVLAGAFSLYFYKYSATKKIKGYSRELSPMELSLAGGTSFGAAAFGGMLYIIAELTAVVLVIAGALT